MGGTRRVPRSSCPTCRQSACLALVTGPITRVSGSWIHGQYGRTATAHLAPVAIGPSWAGTPDRTGLVRRTAPKSSSSWYGFLSWFHDAEPCRQAGLGLAPQPVRCHYRHRQDPDPVLNSRTPSRQLRPSYPAARDARVGRRQMLLPRHLLLQGNSAAIGLPVRDPRAVPSEPALPAIKASLFRVPEARNRDDPDVIVIITSAAMKPVPGLRIRTRCREATQAYPDQDHGSAVNHRFRLPGPHPELELIVPDAELVPVAAAAIRRSVTELRILITYVTRPKGHSAFQPGFRYRHAWPRHPGASAIVQAARTRNPVRRLWRPA